MDEEDAVEDKWDAITVGFQTLGNEVGTAVDAERKDAGRYDGLHGDAFERRNSRCVGYNTGECGKRAWTRPRTVE